MSRSIGLFALIGTIASLAAAPTAAATKYDPLPVQMELATVPPELQKFFAKMKLAYDLAGQAAPADILALFSKQTEIFEGGQQPDNRQLKSLGKTDNRATALAQIAKSMHRFSLDPQAKLKDISAATVAGALAEYMRNSRFVGHLADSREHLCTMAVVNVEQDALTKAEKQRNEDTDGLFAVPAPLNVYASKTLKGRVVETLPANIAIQVKLRPNNLADPWEMITPSGKTGYIAGLSVADIYYEGLCFSQQADKNWLIDTIILREF